MVPIISNTQIIGESAASIALGVHPPTTVLQPVFTTAVLTPEVHLLVNGTQHA